MFELSEYQRYGRQLILPEIGVKGQTALKNTRVLIVGAGGLGCPAALYLAAAGIGCLGILDYDEVEISNLHRQILHTQKTIGVEKAHSASQAISRLNPHVEVIPHVLQLSSQNALDIISSYDIVVDATDNVATRYLVNDACVFAKKPLVSGSALRFEGQLTVYNHNGGPCYRCFFPVPPPPETVTNCSDGGVLGVIPGVIGSLQALEVIKIATNLDEEGQGMSGRLLVFDGLRMSFTQVKLRSRQKKCEVCGDNPSITRLINYTQFCGADPTDKDKPLQLLARKDRITVEQLNDIIKQSSPHVLIDVRSPTEMEICHIDNSINLPLDDISEQTVNNIRKAKEPVYVVCRQGNDSQRAVLELRKILGNSEVIKDIIGGLHAWAKRIDKTFPVY